MKRIIGALALLSALGGCQSTEPGQYMGQPYGSYSGAMPPTGTPMARMPQGQPMLASTVPAPHRPETVPAWSQGSASSIKTYSSAGTCPHCAAQRPGGMVNSSTVATMAAAKPMKPQSTFSSGVVQASYVPSDRGSRVLVPSKVEVPVAPPLEDTDDDKEETTDPPELPVVKANAEVKEPQMTKLPHSIQEDAPKTLPISGIHMFNSKRISINYEVKGSMGAGVDLYVTRDGQKWQTLDLEGQDKSPLVVEVDAEGRYGFSMTPAGSKKSPKPGDPPQFWVEVDTTKPVVHLRKIEGGMEGSTQNLRIYWKVSDKNLDDKPITLSYAEKATGPWTKIATHIENTGSFSWKAPSSVPARFFVKVEAADVVGNLASDQTPKPIVVEMAEPTVSILSLEPAGKR